MAHFLDRFLGDPSKKFIKSVEPIVKEIGALEPHFEKLSNKELREETEKLKEEVQKQCPWLKEEKKAEGRGLKYPDYITKEEYQENYQKAEERALETILTQAFALAREAAKRTIKQRHFDVQLIGGIALHRGNIAEMKTGEGKTLAATLPVLLNALLGHGVHVVTVNDYLASRDAAWMGQIYNLLGLSVAALVHDRSLIFDRRVSGRLREISRKEAYQADITYGTNSEFGFDYLRDNMAPAVEFLVQRPLHFAIIDEVDSILIDEARTPLIISAPAEESASLYQKFARLARTLEEGEDYIVDEKMRTVSITNAGIAKVEQALNVDNIYSAENQSLAYHLEEALRAHALFKRDRHYVVKEGEVIIVDEFTGRLMPGRRYSEGLHQAIEAKEGVEVQRESDTLATISIQNFFRLYRKLAGMTGTAATEAEEFLQVYGMDVISVPTNAPVIRTDLPDRVYKTEEQKFKAIVEEVRLRNQKSQPVLLGTISVEKNEFLSRLLNKNGIKHEILNAKNHEREAHIIANAGRLGAVTLATNMAGRGTDIVLGGAKPEEKVKLESESKSENEREGDISDSSVEYAHTKEEETFVPIVAHRSVDEWRKEHEAVLKAGGLHVIGSERHESRRIDNQLRGRSGRQGDPGSTQFFISMEDDLMRIFGGDRMKRLMDRLGLPDDQPIENRMISRSIEAAQKKVEGFNFDSRKHVLEYDNVMEKHRTAIYAKRRKILFSGDLSDEILENVREQARQLVDAYAAGGSTDRNVDQLINDLAGFIPMTDFEREHLKSELSREVSNSDLEQTVVDLFEAAYRAKVEEIGPDLMKDVEKAVSLRTIDRLWVDHLNSMNALRSGIGLKGYAQTDPLAAYKQEGYFMFQRLLSTIKSQTIRTLFHIEKRESEEESEKTIKLSLLNRAGMIKTGASESLAGGSIVNMLTTCQQSTADIRQSSEERIQTVVRKLANTVDSQQSTAKNQPPVRKLGRNDPCYCGSGKKYKKCHGR